METTVFASILAFALALQVFATWRLRRSASYAAEQKSVQMRLIWLLPVVGAAMVLAVMQQDGELGRDRSGEQRGGNGTNLALFWLERGHGALPSHASGARPTDHVMRRLPTASRVV